MDLRSHNGRKLERCWRLEAKLGLRGRGGRPLIRFKRKKRGIIRILALSTAGQQSE
jgi:hypothetical protein